MAATNTNLELFNLDSDGPSAQVQAAIDLLSTQGNTESRGAIFTKREVVDFILDLVGYTEHHPLFEMKILEPSFGAGDFLLPIIDRLVKSWKRSKKTHDTSPLKDAIRAIELHSDTYFSTHAAVVSALISAGIKEREAEDLANCWLIKGDFLLTGLQFDFNFVVGNPPYVRQELIPDILLREYRRKYKTIYDRADLYIPFIERSLSLLCEKGRLGFICADRWMKNKYGGPLRNYVAGGFHLLAYVDMVNTDAFHTEVDAYPAITVIAKEKGTSTRIAHQPTIDRAHLGKLACELEPGTVLGPGSSVRELSGITNKSEPWLIEASDQMALIRRLEGDFPLLEDAGCKVGIGVATGADKAFIGKFEDLNVEPDRKIRLATTKDIMYGEVAWQGSGVINPFHDDGRLVPLDDYPKLKRYLEERKDVIAGRHCAQKSPNGWYRTIDRITPSLAKKPKLLIPDIKGQAHIVYEPGELYPHHNLYYVTSDTWDLRALQAVLMSSITRLFIATYSTKMRGGFLRFQAQYLRRIRIPAWKDVPAKLRQELARAGEDRDICLANRASFKLYKLTKQEEAAIGEE